MRNLFLFLGMISVAAMTGCQGGKRGVDVYVTGRETFPKELAGRWVAPSQDFWVFEFDRDGTISGAAIGMGGVEIVPGSISKFPARHGGLGVFQPGTWTVRYDEESRELSVEVIIEHFNLDTRGGHALEGSTTDLLIGPVTADYSTWEADLFSKEKLTAFIPEATTFSDISEFEFKKKVVFTKEN